jgi:hypothetical protein
MSADQLAAYNALSCGTVTADLPYCLRPHPEGRVITRTLANLPQRTREQLLCTVDTFGDFTTALADFYDEQLAGLTLQDGTGLVGAGATAAEIRLTGFQKSLLDYQKALLALRAHKGSGHAANAAKAKLTHAVRVKHQLLQMRYRAEIKKFVKAVEVGKNRGGPLTSAERGITLATRGRKHRRLNVANSAQASRLAKLATATRYAGNGLIVLDAGIRVTRVRRTYESGGDWQRQAVLETTGFGAGGAAGLLVGNGVVAGLTALGLAATPVGWVVMISLAAAAGFGAAYYADNKGQKVARIIYERGW